MNYKNFLFLVLSPMNAVLMIILNIIEIGFLVLRRKSKKKIKTFIYFINLALSDLFLGVLIITVKILTLFEQKDTPTTTAVRLFLQNKAISISLYISALTIAVLTFERMLAVKKPIFYSRIRFRTKCIISAIIWFVSAITVVILHFAVKDDELEYSVTPGIIFTTTFLTIICYLIIKRTLNKRVLKQSNGAATIHSFDNKQQHQLQLQQQKQHDQHQQQQRYQQQQQQQIQNKTKQIHDGHNKQERHFLQFCIKSFIIFLICWMPLAIFGVLFSSGLLHDWRYTIQFRFTAHVLAFANSVASPILFLVHNKAWKYCIRKKDETVALVSSSSWNTTDNNSKV